MKKIFLLYALIFLHHQFYGQDVMKIQGGASITIQTGAELILQGGLSLEDGSNLHNNGTIYLQNNIVANQGNWSDQSILGALTGNGIVIFSSTHSQQFTGATKFYTVYINTNELTINNDFSVSNLLRLVKGRINTSNYVVALINSASTSLENDATNSGYSNSWINGNFRRSVATNANAYDFPVGNAARSNLLKFLNNNIAGTSYLTSSFILKQGTDAGLNVTENGNVYTAVNNGGVWKLIPDVAPTGGNYALHLYFNGFTGLADNRFGILKRPDASTDASDWMVPPGSLLEPINGPGRRVSDGFSRRYNISTFSQFGIGEFNPGTPCEIKGQSQVCTGSLNNIYSGPAGMTTYFWTVTGAGFAGSNTGPTLNVTVPNTGSSFTINLITTLNGAQSQCSKTVTITSNPTCEISGQDNLCMLSTNNSYSGPGNMSTYFWTASPGLQITGSNTLSSVNITAVAPGPQLLTLNSTWLSGCISQCSKMVNVTPVVPCAITGESSVGAGTTNNIYTAPANLDNYHWSASGNALIIGSNTQSSVNLTAGTSGSFTLTLTTTLNGCTRTCNSTVVVNPVITYDCDINGEVETCNGATEIFKTTAVHDSYEWSVSGSAMINGPINGQSVSIISTATGNYTITLQTTRNGMNCSISKTINVIECVGACTYTQGFYHNPKASACYNNAGLVLTTSDHMLAAFGITNNKVFGNIANRRFFTLYRTDIINGNIFKMLPGGGTAKAIDIDNKPPYDGAYYNDQGTWSLVPLQNNGPQKGRIRNVLLSQTIVLWFNIQNNSNLASISLVDDTLVTRRTAGCGSKTPVGDIAKFGLPHSVIVFLNGNNGYAPTVQGLFNLANDILGGVSNGISPATINEAVDMINNAFDECRILVATIPYNNTTLLKDIFTKVKQPLIKETGDIKVVAYPNPYDRHFQLQIWSGVTAMAKVEFFTVHGQKVYEVYKPVVGNQTAIVPYVGDIKPATLVFRVTVGRNTATGMVLKPN